MCSHEEARPRRATKIGSRWSVDTSRIWDGFPRGGAFVECSDVIGLLLVALLLVGGIMWAGDPVVRSYPVQKRRIRISIALLIGQDKERRTLEISPRLPIYLALAGVAK